MTTDMQFPIVRSIGRALPQDSYHNIQSTQAEGLLCMTTAYLNRIATAVPEHDVHHSFVVFAEQMLDDPRLRTVFRRMVSRADIAHRYSFLDPQKGSGPFSSHDANGFYRLGNFPDTCLLYTSPSPRDGATSRMPSSA